MFTVKFYTAGRKTSFIMEASSVQTRRVDDITEVIMQTVIDGSVTRAIGRGADYQFAVVENAAGKTTEMIGERI